jgi:endo-1,4-beta-mannosidase
MRRQFRLPGNGPAAWLGANFWSRVGGPRMWTGYDHDTVAAELAVLAGHGLTVTRSFLFWPDVMPAPDRLDEELLARYADFLDLHSETGLCTFPTLIVGHMSGQNWDPAWRDGRDLYTDTWLVGRQAWYAEQVARRFGGHPAVAGWLLSNEMPLYGGRGTPEAVTTWAQLVIQGLRAGGARQPVSLGDGAWTVETSGRDTGYRLRELAPLVDWVGPHSYPMSDDAVRQNLHAAFTVELCHLAGLPVLLEEFGASTEFGAPEAVAHYYRQVLHTTLLAGATGWIAWNNTDFDDLIGVEPYSHHPFELHFGLTDNDGAPKPALREMAAFAATLSTVEPERCRRADTGVALVVGAHLDTVYPFSDQRDRDLGFAALEQSCVAAREADLAPALVRESDGIAAGARLYLLPSAKQLTGPGWQRLAELAAGGATVYVSYSPGDNTNQRGPWYPGLDAMFGVRHRLRYGLVDRLTGDTLTVRFTGDVGDLAAGAELTFAAAGNASLRAYLPVEPAGAEVLAVDDAGRPVLLRRKVGAGAVVLCTVPLEAMAALSPEVNPEPTWRLYRALAREAGAEPVATVDDPRVLVDALDRADGTRFVWLVSQHPEPLAVRPIAAGELSDVDTGETVGSVTLPPYGVRILRTRCVGET